MHDVLYVSKLTCNLFSVRAAAGKGNIVKFGRSRCWIRDEAGKLYGMGSLVDKLYISAGLRACNHRVCISSM